MTDSRISSLPRWAIPPAEQLAVAERLNRERRWGFDEAVFAGLDDGPEWPERPFGAVVLEISLDSVEQTFEEAWRFAASVQPDAWRWEEVRSDPEHLRLGPGLEHRRGLYWVALDLAGPQGVVPTALRSERPRGLAHAAVLWAAGFFPEWIRSMDGTSVPYVAMPGYELSVPGAPAWSDAPRLYWASVRSRIELDALLADARFARSAAATILSPSR